MEPLPIDEVTDAAAESLRRHPRLVLIAPPGAGKTTRIPPLLLDQGLARGQVLVLEPRRIAARLSATRVANERGCALGAEVGYRVRFEDRTGPSTRIVFLTEGILSRRMISDPLLEGVGAVVLDEFHERSVHADLALAFLRELSATRPELRLVVMSATLDPGPVARFLGGCPVLTSEGRQHPLEVRYLERPDERPADVQVVAGVKEALRGGGDGDVLAFLPGVREIGRAARALRGDLTGVDVLELHGELEAKAQDRAVAPRASGDRRRVVLSTNVAESSLTIPGVDTVVDAGLVKRSRHDPAIGVDHLELGRISRFSAEQRAGRAARLGPGRVYRRWTEMEHQRLAEAEPPELLRVDLAPVVLAVVAWSGTNPQRFEWLDAPPAGAVDRAVHLLRRLGALPSEGFRLTGLGERLAALPVHPRLGRLLLDAGAAGHGRRGALVAALASERDLLRDRAVLRDRVGRSDLLERLERLERVAAGESAEALGLDRRGARAALAAAARLERFAGRPTGPARDPEETLLRAVLAAFPDRVALRRGSGLQLAEGGRAVLAPESVVKEGPLLVAVQLDGQGAGKTAVVRLASHIERSWLTGVNERIEARFDKERERVDLVRVTLYEALELEQRPDPNAPLDRSDALAAAAAADLDRALPLTDALESLLRRIHFVRRYAPELDLPEVGPDVRRELLPMITPGKRSFAELRAADLGPLLLDRLPVRLDHLAPTHVPVPSGRRAPLRYETEGPPVLSIRLQEVFGLLETPRVLNGRVPVKMELLAPNHRPVQVTQDLASFWSRTYDEVRKELRRRYPKHDWPEDPADGIPSARARRRR